MAAMSIFVRPMQPDEARRFLEIHHASVRGLAAADYPPAVIDAWAPLAVTDAALGRFVANRDSEIRLLAEIDGSPAGIGAIVLSNSELRACYVLPSAARRGVGSALVVEIERIAREHRLDHLHVESSLTAEPFYTALGYEIERRGDLTIAPGVGMAAVRMRKDLALG
jgi:putative acetyltransferase